MEQDFGRNLSSQDRMKNTSGEIGLDKQLFEKVG